MGHADLAVTAARYTRSNVDSQRAALAAVPPLVLPGRVVAPTDGA